MKKLIIPALVVGGLAFLYFKNKQNEEVEETPTPPKSVKLLSVKNLNPKAMRAAMPTVKNNPNAATLNGY